MEKKRAKSLVLRVFGDEDQFDHARDDVKMGRKLGPPAHIREPVF